MISIPKPLAERFNLYKELDTAYDLLQALQSGGKGIDMEEAFLKEKITTIEDALDAGLSQAEKLIDVLRFDQAAWTAARLRFLQGYEWSHIAERIGMSIAATKSRVYRADKSRTHSCEAVIAEFNKQSLNP